MRDVVTKRPAVKKAAPKAQSGDPSGAPPRRIVASTLPAVSADSWVIALTPSTGQVSITLTFPIAEDPGAQVVVARVALSVPAALGMARDIQNIAKAAQTAAAPTAGNA